jgi:hypothetical protein
MSNLENDVNTIQIDIGNKLGEYDRKIEYIRGRQKD